MRNRTSVAQWLLRAALVIMAVMLVAGCEGVFEDLEDEDDGFDFGSGDSDADEDRRDTGHRSDGPFEFTCNVISDLGICAEYTADTELEHDRLWAGCSAPRSGHSCPCGGAAICRHVNNAQGTTATSYAYPDTGLVAPASTVQTECVNNGGTWLGTC